MLSESTIEKLAERLVNRVEQANIYTLKILGNRIRQIGTLIPSDIHRLNQLYEYGNDIKKIMQELARITDLNIEDIYNIFNEIAKKEYGLAKSFYDYRHKTHIPYESNIGLKQQVKAIADLTVNKYLNISKTTGFQMLDINKNKVFMDIPKTYSQVVDEALLSISSGAEGYEQCMQDTIKQLGKSGIKTLEYGSGYTRRLDSAIRMNIMDGIRELSNKVQNNIGKDVGADAVEISVHEYPAPDHANIQGHIFKNEEFKKMQTNQNYKDINYNSYTALKRIISQWNCYHYVFSVIAKISKSRYTQEQLDNIIEDNEKGFEFEGKHYSLYEGSQIQRQIETEIRRQKDIQIIARASGNKELTQTSQAKINQLTIKYNNLSKTSGLATKIDRLRIDGYKKVKV